MPCLAIYRLPPALEKIKRAALKKPCKLLKTMKSLTLPILSVPFAEF